MSVLSSEGGSSMESSDTSLRLGLGLFRNDFSLIQSSPTGKVHKDMARIIKV